MGDFDTKQALKKAFMSAQAISQPDEVLKLFGISGDEIEQVALQMQEFKDLILQDAETMPFGCCMHSDQAYWDGWVYDQNIKIPRVILSGMNVVRSLGVNKLSALDSDPVEAFKKLSVLGFKREQKEFSEKEWNSDQALDRIISNQFSSRKVLNDDKSATSVNSKMWSVVALQQFLLTDEESDAFKEKCEKQFSTFDVQILELHKIGMPLAEIAKEMDTDEDLLVGYVQTRPALMDADMVEISIDNLNPVPFVRRHLDSKIRSDTTLNDVKSALFSMAAVSIDEDLNLGEIDTLSLRRMASRFLTSYDSQAINTHCMKFRDSSKQALSSGPSTTSAFEA